MLERSLAGPIGSFVKFSNLQDYGVDKIFYLENDNADSSQRNVVFIARGENLKQIHYIAGMSLIRNFSNAHDDYLGVMICH